MCYIFCDFLRRSLTRDDPSAFAAPAQFGPFRVLHQVGVGALGPVYRTYEPERDRLVAVKVFRLDITPEQARSLADELSRVAEAGLFHPSIVEPISAGVEGSVAYSADEYVAAESLDVAMRQYAPASIGTVLPFITQLAGAIDFARAAGVGHGGLHPRDMFVTPDEARVTGFGVVEALERTGVRAPVRRPYTSPERIAGVSWSTPADVFSLAAVTYELLTGRRPSGLGAEIGVLTSVDGPAGPLHDVLARAMDEDPARRFQTALAFVSALDAAAHGRAVAGMAAVAPAASSSTETPAEPAGGVPATAAAAAGTASILNLHEPAHGAAEVEFPTEPGEEDILGERDEDEAHHQLSLAERSEAERRDPEDEPRVGAPLDEDIEAEAEADRYAADDFLLDAAGAASARPGRVDDFRAPREEPRTAPGFDDEARVDEPSAMRFDHEEAPAVRPVATPAVQPPRRDSPPVSAPPPVFAQYADAGEPRERSASRWPLGLTLLLGLLIGLGGGYALWGRSGAPSAAVGREFSEQAVAPPSSAAPASTAAAASGSAATSDASAPDTGSAGKPSEPASPPPVPARKAPVVEEKPDPPSREAAPRSAAGRSTAASRPRSGSIVVRSTPPGAGVTLNGRWRGRTPLALENLPFAKYEVRVVQPGHVPAQQVVTLSAGDPDRTLSMRLEQMSAGTAAAGRAQPGTPRSGVGAFSGTVFVDSRPRGAKVFIDGKEVGTTPVNVPDVPIGTHVVRLELPDHQTWTSTTRVSAGQQSRVTGSLDRIQ